MLTLPSLVSWLNRGFVFVLVFVISTIPLRWGNQGIYAEVGLKPVVEIRTIYPGEWGGESAAGLAYSTGLRQFFSLDGDHSAQSAIDKTTVSGFTPYEDLVGMVDLPFAVADAVNITYDDSSNRLFLLSPDLTELIQVKINSNGILDPATVTRYAIGQVDLKSAQGMTVDGEGGLLFILDSSASQIARIALQEDLSQAEFIKVSLAAELDGAGLRGIGLNPATRHLYALDHKQHQLYELGHSGELVAQYDLSGLELTSPRAVAFAPSADLTDDPSIVHLFIADGGVPQSQGNQTVFPFNLYLSFLGTDRSGLGAADEAAQTASSDQESSVSKIVEVTLEPAEVVVEVARTNAIVLTPIRTIETKNFNHNGEVFHIPDPSGMAYVADSPTAPSGHLLVSDAEIEESVDDNPPAYFNDVNLFYLAVPEIPVTLDDIGSTLDFSKEPVGVAYDYVNEMTYFVDDNPDRVFSVDQAGNWTTLFTTRAFNSEDPEGLEYLDGHLFIADGTNREVYKVTLDGQLVDNFDTSIHDISDPSGLGSDPATGNLLLVGGNNNPDHIFEFSTASNTFGALVETYDISAANGRRLDAVVMAPSSEGDGSTLSYYIADRRQDNDANRLENDGAIYELASAGPPPPPPPPAGNGDIIFVSSTSGGTAEGIAFADEDVLAYDTNTGTWAMFFDGSDVGLKSLDVDAFFLLDDDDDGDYDSMLLSFTAEGNVGTLGLVDDSDVVRFIPTSVGPNTAGTFEWYFDGSDVGLSVNGEDIDALVVLDDGRLVISTVGNPTIPGLTGLKDEDLLLFTPTQLGQTTSGTWELYFDGSDVGLSDSSSEDLNGAWIDEATNNIYLTTVGTFIINNASGDGADIFICTPNSLGDVTTCNFNMYWDGSAHGFGGEIADAIEIDQASTLVSSAAVAALRAIEHAGEGDDPNADPNEGPDDVPDQEHRLYLPHLQP